MTGRDLADLLDEHGYDFFTGVPCSLVEALLAELETRAAARDARSPYIPSVREDIAIGLAAGAWLGGRAPAVVMQNSGLGTSLNALVSLSLLYRLPALLLVTWRGHGGADAPEHILMGEISPALLDLIHIPHRVLTATGAGAELHWAKTESSRLSQPVALLVPPGLLETRAHEAGGVSQAPVEAGRADTSGPPPVASISRSEALQAAVKALGREPVVHANGYICRESFAVRDRPENFYMIGSMGLASSIGLGAALARDDRTVVIFDGDGNLLMNLGILPMIGDAGRRRRPRRFVHIVFDNGSPESRPDSRMNGRWRRPLLLLAGAAVVLWLVWDLGATSVWEAFHTLGWRLAVLVLAPFSLAVVLDSLGWRILLAGPGAPFLVLVGARLAGEAVTLATPTASVGGEPLKAYLVREHVPLDEGLASIIVDKTTVVMGQALFLAVGLLIALALEPPRALLYAMTGLLAAEIVGVGGFALAQVAGVLGGGGGWLLDRLGLGGIERHREKLTR